MAEPAEKLSVDDVWPIAKKLPRDQKERLAKRLLRELATPQTDAEAYATAPPRDDEFSSDDGALAWEGEGWEEFYDAKG